MDDREKMELCADLLEKLRPVLRGQPPEIQGGTLAMAVALWLAGHETQYRDSLLKAHAKTVRSLTPQFAETIREKLRQRAH